jgi:hypothetical protein
MIAAGPLLTAQQAKTLPRVRAAEGEEKEEDVRKRMEDEKEYFGPMAPGYLNHKLKVSQEIARQWGHTLPAMGRLKGATAPAAGGQTWTNLGPFTSFFDTQSAVDSGRPSAIVAHPTDANIVYLAHSGGGVFKATNAASSGAWNWTAITDGLPTGSATGTLAIGALIMDPSDPNTLILGLGDGDGTYADQPSADGKGLYKTTDAGANWSALGDWTQAGNNTTRIHQILAVSSSLLLVGGNDGLWRSTNGGTNWTRISVGAHTTGEIWSVSKLSATEFILGYTDNTDANGAIFYSSDAGLTWTQATIAGGVNAFDRVTVRTSNASGTNAYAIAEDDTTGNFLVGVLKSTDKGHSWSLVNGSGAPNRLFTDYASYNGNDTGDGSQAFYNHCLIVDPDDSNRLFVGSNLALWRSMDGGSTWQQMTHWYAGTRVYAHADWHTGAVYNNAGTKYFYFGNDGGLCIVRDPWRSTIPSGAAGGAGVNNDLTFIDNTKNAGLANHLVYNLGSTLASNAADAKYRISLGLQDNGTRIRTDAGSGLQSSGRFDANVGGDGFGTVWHPVDATKVLASLYSTRVYLSTNSGGSFSSSTSGIGSETKPFRTIITLDESDATGNTVYTASNTKAYKSTNFGTSWTALPAAFTASTTARVRGIAVAKTNSNNITVLTSASVNVSANGGSSWTNVAASVPGNTPTGARFSSVWYDTTNASVMYLTSAALDHTQSHVWKSTNGGTTWTAIDGGGNGFPAGGVAHVIKNSPSAANTLFVGTDYGVFQSTNGGTTWSRFGNGLPSVRVSDIYIAPDSSFVRVATFGRGVWEIATPTGPAVSVSPTAATIITNSTLNITPTVTNTTTDNTVNWTTTGGTILPSNTATAVPATFTAPGSAGTYTVTATTVETPASTANSVITVVAPSAVTVTLSPTPTTTTTTSSVVAFTGSVSGITDTGVNWTASGGSFNVTTGGSVNWTAPGTAGSYTVTATANGAPTRSASTTVTVVDPATITVSVSPTTKTLLGGGSQSFTATVSAGSVTWSLSPSAGAGTITPSGTTCTYNAPATISANQSVTLTATSALNGAKTASAAISLKTLDLNGDGVVDVLDILELTKRTGSAVSGDLAIADLNGDGVINDADLAILLAGI